MPSAAPAETAGRAAGRGSRSRLTGVLLPAVICGPLVAAAVALLVTGASLYVVSSPSMGTAAPVGSLVVTAPAAVADLRAGDVVTYRPAGGVPTTTHRVVQVEPDGVVVQGDLNGSPDAPLVRPAMLVGRVAVILPAVGTLLRLVPWLALGILSVFLLTWPLRNEELRASLRAVGASAVGAVVLAVQHPLLDWIVLAQRAVPGGLLLQLVPTGLLPLRMQAHGGGVMTLAPGVVGTLRAPADAAGRVGFDAGIGLEPWGWAVLVVVCLTPLIAVLIFGLPARRDAPPERAA